MYEELVKNLRYLAKQGTRYGVATITMRAAADAIEELEREYESVSDSLNHSVELVRKYQERDAVRHGRWIKSEDAFGCYCSVCNCNMPMFLDTWYDWYYSATPYCPKCGAKMDQGGDV